MFNNFTNKTVDLVFDVIDDKGPITSSGMTNYLNMTTKTINQYIKQLREENLIYISDWVKGHNNNYIMAFSAGRRMDVPRPPMLDQAIRRQEKKQEYVAEFVPRPDVAAAWMFNGHK